MPEEATPSTIADGYGLPVIDVPANAVLVAPMPESSPPALSTGAPAGPVAFVGYAPGKGGQALTAVDLGSGQAYGLPLALAANEQVVAAQADRGWLTLLVIQRNGDPCGEAKQIPWRIVTAPLGSDGLPASAFRQLDAGVALRSFILPGGQGLGCPAPMVPPLAMAAGRVAYGVEAPTAANPAASRIIVRSLADGSLVRSLDVPQQVYSLALSESAVAWVQSANGVTAGRSADWRVMEAQLPDDAATEVPVGETAGPAHGEPPGIVLDGSALVASLDQYSGSSGTVVRVLGRKVETLDPGGADRNCAGVGAAAGDVAFWCNASLRAGDTATVLPSRVGIWSAASGLRLLGGVPGDPGIVWLQDDWLMWRAVDSSSEIVVAVDLAKLR